MASYLIRSVPCPAEEFGLEPCEEYIRQRATSYPGSWENPPEFNVQEEPDTACDCEKQLTGNKLTRYWQRVHERLDAEDFKPDTDDW